MQLVDRDKLSVSKLKKRVGGGKNKRDAVMLNVMPIRRSAILFLYFNVVKME